MKFLIISYVSHIEHNRKYFAYAPYVSEMNIWLKHVNQVEIIAPLNMSKKRNIDVAYKHNNLKFNRIPIIEFTSVLKSIISFFKLPYIIISIFKACRKTDHIHLRCPGNIGLLACFVQIFFPSKKKTAKYAGNWDPKSNQPLSYRIQKWILKNTFLTKNMTVLVYGKWKNQTKNIKPFFTASFANKDRIGIQERDYANNLKFIFIGSLVKGKRPLLAIKIVEELIKKGKKVELQIFGDGDLKQELEGYVNSKKLNRFIKFEGNKKLEKVKLALINSHFLILASKSEGWPKAVAEAMFFGVIPIVTKISCVPFMVDYGKRGILIEPNAEPSVNLIIKHLNTSRLKEMSLNAAKWSQEYTIEKFENEIKNLLNE